MSHQISIFLHLHASSSPSPSGLGILGMRIPKPSMERLLANPLPLPPLLGLSLPLTPAAALSLAHRAPGAAPPGPTSEHGAPGQGQDGPGQAKGILASVKPPRVLLGSSVP